MCVLVCASSEADERVAWLCVLCAPECGCACCSAALFELVCMSERNDSVCACVRVCWCGGGVCRSRASVSPAARVCVGVERQCVRVGAWERSVGAQRACVCVSEWSDIVCVLVRRAERAESKLAGSELKRCAERAESKLAVSEPKRRAERAESKLIGSELKRRVGHAESKLIGSELKRRAEQAGLKLEHQRLAEASRGAS